MLVIKKNKEASNQDLIIAIEKFIELLRTQKEDDAVNYLSEVIKELQSCVPGTKEHQDVIKKIFDAFEGDLELSAYTYQRADTEEWSLTDELFQASTRVLNLARRFSP